MINLACKKWNYIFKHSANNEKKILENKYLYLKFISSGRFTYIFK